MVIFQNQWTVPLLLFGIQCYCLPLAASIPVSLVVLVVVWNDISKGCKEVLVPAKYLQYRLSILVLLLLRKALSVVILVLQFHNAHQCNVHVVALVGPLTPIVGSETL